MCVVKDFQAYTTWLFQLRLHLLRHCVIITDLITEFQNRLELSFLVH